MKSSPRDFLRRHPRLLALARRVRTLLRRYRPNQAPTSPKPNQRCLDLVLPRRSGQDMRTLMTVEAPAHLYIPKLLEEGGLGGYEPDALACFLAMVELAGPGAVLDVGANIGVYAWLAAALTDREVHAFEPTPEIVTVARHIARRNHLRYEVHELAFAAFSGRARLFLSDRTDTSNSLAEGFRPSSRQLEVRVETLDRWVEETGVAPAVVKIDTESSEPDVLNGGPLTLQRYRPWILCEVLKGRVEPALTAIMDDFGYQHWYHVTDQVPYQPSAELVGDETYRHMMWLFLPEVPSPEFWERAAGWRERLTSCTNVV